MKKSKKVWCFVATLLLFAGILTGCGGEKTQLILTTGFSKDDVLLLESADKSQKVTLTEEELNFYTAVTKARLEIIFGTEIWAISNDGYTAADDLENVVFGSLTDVKNRYLFALSKGYVLSFETQEYLKTAAHNCFLAMAQSNTDTAYTEELIYELYREKALGDLAYAEVTKDVDYEISDDDARVISVQWIYVPLVTKQEDGSAIALSDTEKEKAYDRIKEAYGKLREGEEFFGVMASYSADSSDTKKICKNELSPILEEVIVNLDREEVSDIVTTEDGYYIVKCLNTMDRDETELHRRQLLSESKDKKFEEEFTSFLENVSVYRNEELLASYNPASITSADVDFEYYYKQGIGAENE